MDSFAAAGDRGSNADPQSAGPKEAVMWLIIGVVLAIAAMAVRTQELGAHAAIPGGDPNWCVPIEVLRGIRTIARHPNFRVALDLPHGIRPPPTQQLACT